MVKDILYKPKGIIEINIVEKVVINIIAEKRTNKLVIGE